MRGLALLLLRVTVGGLLAGHGAQKLFGWFGGHGMAGTSGWLESIGLRPGRRWAALAGLSELGGGMLTVLGLLNPLGPLLAMGSMLMATVKVHAGRPVWATEGGAELPLTNMAVQAALIATGPGRFSVDRLVGLRLPRWIALPGLAAMVGTVVYAVRSSEARKPAHAATAEERPAPAQEAMPPEGAPAAIPADAELETEVPGAAPDELGEPGIAATQSGRQE